MIWLVDYTTYRMDIDPALKRYRAAYFRVKGYKRKCTIGETAPARTRTYSNGLLRLATLLRRGGVPCRYLHADMLETLLDNGEPLPEIVAFSTVCPTVPRAAALAARVKRRSPATRVYAGGPQINAAPRLTAEKFPVFDRLIVGYEERAASAIAGVPIAAGGGPYVDFSLLPYAAEEYAINTFTAMGCPFSCAYCADGRAPKFSVSDDAMLSQLAGLPRRKLVHVFDSVLGSSTERALAVCRELQRLDHGFLLSCDMRAELMTEELAREMEKAGFVEVRLGIESADEELLKKNGRTLSPQSCIGTLKMLRDTTNLYLTLYSVTGLPGTTRAGQERTLEMFHGLLVRRLADEIKNALYVPYPYDDIDYAARGVIVKDDDWAHYDRQSYPVYETPQLRRDELWELYLETTKTIAESWRESLGFERFDDVPDTGDYYGEYFQANYRID